MRKDDERDASIDTFLRNSLRSGRAAGGSSGACVEAEAIAAWAEGTLSSIEAAAVETHLAGCAACQEVLALVARTAPTADVTPSLWQRWHLRWAVPITAAATAVAIWVAVPDERKEPIQDAFTAADSTPPAAPGQISEERQAANPREPANAVAPSAARERGEPVARDADSSLRAQPEKREVRQEKEEADLQGLRRESTREPAQEAAAREPASAPAAAAVAQSETRPLADAPAPPAQTRQAAFAPIEVISPDPAIRWRVLPAGQLERSTNAGKTWEPVALQEKVAAVRALTATAAIVTTADGREFRTDDQGKTWNPVQR